MVLSFCPMFRRASTLLLVGAALSVALIVPVLGQDDEPRIDVIEISGNLDASAIDFVADRIIAAADVGSVVAIIQIDSAATLSDDILELLDLVGDPPLPVVVWVGPAPAVAYGGAAHLLSVAAIRAAAPGVEIGHAIPIVAGDTSGVHQWLDPLNPYIDSGFEVSESVDGLVELVAPSLNNLISELDGLSAGGVTLETLRETDDGTAAVRTVLWEPGLWVRTLRTAVGVEAAFFFLVIGLTVAVFEFYAIGPGIAAGVAVACLLVSGYGLSVLPLRWWAVALTVIALWLLTVTFQRGGAGPLTLYGAVSMFFGGRYFTDAEPQIVPSWWIILVIVVSVVAFYVFAMSTVARSRFSTPTIGREHMIGRTGTAITEFGPNGHVEVDGARWQAAAHREAGLEAGDPVEVVGVDGLFLEVEPIER